MRKILIVDDDVDFSDALSSILKEKSFIVNAIDHTEDAVGYIIENRPDLLILDVMFPENPSGGFDLARKIRKTDEIKEIPIIFLTAINKEFPMDFSAKDIDKEWMPVQDFVEKPVDIDLILQKIYKLLEVS